jgi:hypothetical protein
MAFPNETFTRSSLSGEVCTWAFIKVIIIKGGLAGRIYLPAGNVMDRQ